MSQNEKWLKEVQDRIEYRFRNPDLLLQAFTRRSYSEENGGSDNEILEFIGDRALDLAVTKLLMKKYGYFLSETQDYNRHDDYDEYYSKLDEGELTELKKRLVQKRTLAGRMDRLGWSENLIVGKGDKNTNVSKKDSVKEDLFEAIIGAVTVDSDWNLEKIENVVDLMLEPEAALDEEDSLNYVSIIQDWYFKNYKTNPVFDCIKTCSSVGFVTQTDEIGNKSGSYTCTIRMSILIPVGAYQLNRFFVGYGESKSEARRDLCYKMYYYLVKNGQISSITNEIDNPNQDDAINQLETLARRGYFSVPTYSFKEVYDKNGNPIWSAQCQITEYTVSMNAKASSKKEAKKKAAFKMLEFVLKEED